MKKYLLSAFAAMLILSGCELFNWNLSPLTEDIADALFTGYEGLLLQGQVMAAADETVDPGGAFFVEEITSNHLMISMTNYSTNAGSGILTVNGSIEYNDTTVPITYVADLTYEYSALTYEFDLSMSEDAASNFTGTLTINDDVMSITADGTPDYSALGGGLF